MKEIFCASYNTLWPEIYTWFCENIYEKENNYSYKIIDLPNDCVKMIDVIDSNKKHCFRVLLKATTENFDEERILNWDRTFNNQFNLNAYGKECTLQVCYIHLNDKNKPINFSLFPFTHFTNY